LFTKVPDTQADVDMRTGSSSDLRDLTPFEAYSLISCLEKTSLKDLKLLVQYHKFELHNQLNEMPFCGYEWTMVGNMVDG